MVKKEADDNSSAFVFERLFVCAEFERQVERAEGKDRSQHKYSAEDNENDTQCTGYDTAKIQIGKQSGDDNSDGAISIGHIAFHGKSPLFYFDLMSTL